MNRAGAGKWEVTVAAPAFFHGDLQPIETARSNGEGAALELIPAHLTALPHLFFYGRRLRNLLRDRWDIVHCWEEPYIVAGGQIACWTPKQSRLVFWTGQTRVKNYPPPFAKIERYCFQRCAGWLARGQLGIDAMRQRGHGDRPHEAIGLGVDIEVFSPDRRAGAAVIRELGWPQAGAPIVGYIGRFVEAKGLRTLTAALDRVASPWRAIFLDGGPLHGELERWAGRYGGRVRVVAAVTHDRVPAFVNAIDVLCAPSRTTVNWREIFGRMVIEAFACAVPVLASDSGELPAVVGDAGLILPEDDVAAWGRALAELLDSPGRRRDLAGRGLDRVRQHFTWSAVARKHLDFCERLLDAPAG